MTVVTLDARRITDWDTLHGVFAECFGFLDFYGRNMSVWAD
jgi:RNAse (barnase) inhibitor barstar